MCRQSFGHGPIPAHASRKNTVIRRRSSWQCFGDGSAWIGDRSEKRIQKSSQRHQRSAAVATRDDCIITISAADNASNIQNIEETLGAPNRTVAFAFVAFGKPIATTSLNQIQRPRNEFNYFIQRNSPQNHAIPGRIMNAFLFCISTKRSCGTLYISFYTF